METVLYLGVVVATTLANIFFARGRRPMIANPSLADIERLHEAEEARRRAERFAHEAMMRAEMIRVEAEEERERARACQEAAECAIAHAAEEMRKMKARVEAVEQTARLAQEVAENAVNAAKEQVKRLVQEAREERERATKVREDMERAMAAAREEAQRAQRAADELLAKVEVRRALAEEAARNAVEERHKALEAKEEAEKRLKEGVQPIVTPSPEELAAAKARVQYDEDFFHFAITGVSGSGKSSLVNAFRGLRSRDSGAAAVGVTETTLEMTRYPEANPDIPFIWYDVPGAGTLKCHDWQYFNDQCLYVFDSIIILIDIRFTMTDVAILSNARRFNIPTYIVRSKADQHIQNIRMEMGYDAYSDKGLGHGDELYSEARQQFIEQTKKSVKTNLADANLPDQRVYIVSNTTLVDIIRQKTPKKMIDEIELLNDLYGQAHGRRCIYKV